MIITLIFSGIFINKYLFAFISDLFYVFIIVIVYRVVLRTFGKMNAEGFIAVFSFAFSIIVSTLALVYYKSYTDYDYSWLVMVVGWSLPGSISLKRYWNRLKAIERIKEAD